VAARGGNVCQRKFAVPLMTESRARSGLKRKRFVAATA
jgi:hypothetical protein